ncbi:UNVERIFIED_CONTAM: hypothetical protein K2H54_022967 [Gekko kuhli]
MKAFSFHTPLPPFPLWQTNYRMHTQPDTFAKWAIIPSQWHSETPHRLFSTFSKARNSPPIPPEQGTGRQQPYSQKKVHWQINSCSSLSVAKRGVLQAHMHSQPEGYDTR